MGRVEAQIKLSSDNLYNTKLPDAKQRSKYLFDGKHSSNTAQICMYSKVTVYFQVDNFLQIWILAQSSYPRMIYVVKIIV